MDEATADVANKLEAANNALANSIMLLNTGLPVNVTIRYYDEQNNVTMTKDDTITSGVINEDNVPKQEGYYYLNATIGEDNIPIAYVEAHEGGSVYYALEKNAATGILLDEGERIYLNYKALGNSIPVDYTTSGDAGVNGNEVIGFPETAEKGGNLGFQVALARGYDSVVTVNGQTYEAATEASGANTYSIAVPNDAQNMTVNVEFVKTATVSFDPGVFNDPDYVYLNGRFTYTNGSGQVETEQVGQDGASFDFSFTTNGAWQLDSLQVNGIYLNVPHTRNRGASATTVLYQDAANPCVATLSVTDRNGNNVSYRLSITGAKEDLTITEGNLNGVGWHEVVPSATDGIEFWNSPSQYGQLTEGGLNRPYATDSGNSDGSTPKFQFRVAEGYKNPSVHVFAYDENGEALVDRVVELPESGRSAEVTTTYLERYWDWGWWDWGWHYRDVTVTLATITNNNGVYTIQYTESNTFGDSGVVLQFVEIGCEKATLGVKYDLGEGTGQISDSNTYDVVDNTTAVVSNRMPTAPGGMIFLGWKIKGNEGGPIYGAGDALDFTSEDIVQYVGDGDGERDGYLTLVAQYTNDIAYGSSRPVNVRYFFENEDGNYVEDESMRTTVQGVTGKTLSMLQYDQSVTYKGYDYTFDADSSQTTITVSGSNAIELHYALERVDYTYTAGEGGLVNPESERIIAQKEGAAQGSTATANDGYKFDGWYVNDNGKDVKITDDNAGNYNVELSEDGTKLIPQRHEGKYEGGTFTAKFALDKMSFVQYDLGASDATWADAPDYLTENKRAVVDKNGGPLTFVSGNEAQNYYLDETNGYRYGDGVVLAATEPERHGYTFVGWSNDDVGSNIQAGSTIENYPYNDDGVGNDCLTLHAQWKVDASQWNDVIYLPGSEGGDVQGLPSNVTDQLSGTTQTVGQAAPTRHGYTFDGYAVEGLDGTEALQPGATFEMPANDVTLTAQWKVDESQWNDVIYLPGSEGGDVQGMPDNVTDQLSGTTQTVGQAAPTRHGYTFDGYAVEGLDGTASLQPGATFEMPANDVTLTAQWEADFSDFSVARDEWAYNGSSRQIQVNGVYAGDKLTYTSSNDEVLATCDVTADGIVNAPEFLNVSDSDTVTVTVTRGGKTASAKATMTITPLTITVTPRDIRKTQGQADPTLTSDYSGYLLGETAGWTGALTREPGEAVGTYTISRGSLQLADNPDGNFLAQNYVLVVNEGTFTIVAAPVTPGGGGDTPTPTPGGGGDGTPTPGTPATVTPADDTTTDEVIADDDTALAAPTDTIGDDDTPLAAGAKDEDCWVHWLILLGMILSAVYFVGVGVRRRKFTSSLLGYEDKVLGNDRDNA